VNLAEYARQRIAGLLDRFAERLQAAAGEGSGAAPIRELRVAIRRLTSALRVFGPLYPEGRCKKLRKRLSGLMAAAGAVRDCDVALELLAEAGVPARSAMAVRLRARRHKKDDALRTEIVRWQSRDRVARWRGRLELQAMGNGRMPVEQNARRRLPPLVRQYFEEVRQLLAARPAPAGLHAIRLASKRLRDTLELFVPCYGVGVKTRLAQLQELQQILGEVSDYTAAQTLIQRQVPESPVRRAALRTLDRQASIRASRVRREWRETFDAPGKEHWWLSYLARPARSPKGRL